MRKPLLYAAYLASLYFLCRFMYAEGRGAGFERGVNFITDQHPEIFSKHSTLENGKYRHFLTTPQNTIWLDSLKWVEIKSNQ